jgi:hypothetical protein
MEMHSRFTTLVLAAILAAGCKGSLRSEGDAGPDTGPDVTDDVGEDVPGDTPAPDSVEDAPFDTSADTPADTPADVPTDTIGMPCTTDEECDMHTFCDGDEYCHPSGVCRRSPPPDCDDSDDCTADSCDPVADACVNELIDGDGDLHAPESCGGDDCDDADSTVYAGAPETCGDGLDQDCDGVDNVAGECACAIPLAPGTVDGTTSPMPNNYGGSCRAGGGAGETIYELVLTTATDVLFEVSAPSWDAIVYVREGSCDGTELGCAVDWDPAIILPLSAGTYYVFVDGREGPESGDYTLEVATCGAVTAVTGNNDCPGAHAITAAGSYSGSISTLTDTAQPATCASDSTWRGGRDAWFRLDLTASRTVHLDTLCSDYDTVLYVRNATCTGTESACDDDSSYGASSSLDLTLAAGTYYVIVDSYFSLSVGTYVLNVSGL